MKMIKLPQKKINLINLIIAVIALILSVPSAFNQIRQFFNEQFGINKTEVVYYSVPNDINKKIEKINNGECWESIASIRKDSARCISDNDHYIYDPCFYFVTSDEHDVYFCPTNGFKSTKGILIRTINNDMRNFRIGDTKENVNNNFNFPWMVVFEDNKTCSLYAGGTIEMAFDNKGMMYGCSSNLLVTDYKIESEKYIFGCKKRGSSYYGNCVAKIVVF